MCKAAYHGIQVCFKFYEDSLCLFIVVDFAVDIISITHIRAFDVSEIGSHDMLMVLEQCSPDSIGLELIRHLANDSKQNALDLGRNCDAATCSNAWRIS